MPPLLAACLPSPDPDVVVLLLLQLSAQLRRPLLSVVVLGPVPALPRQLLPLAFCLHVLAPLLAALLLGQCLQAAGQLLLLLVLLLLLLLIHSLCLRALAWHEAGSRWLCHPPHHLVLGSAPGAPPAGCPQAPACCQPAPCAAACAAPPAGSAQGHPPP